MIKTLNDFLKIMKVNDLKKLTVFEPCDGYGRISKALQKMGLNVIVRDKFTLPGSHDFLSDEDPEHFDLLITNPPFSLKKQILEKVLSYPSNVKVILLLPYPFMSSKTVYENFQNKQVHVDLLSPDPKFLHEGKLMSIGSCAWYYFNFPKVQTNISLRICRTTDPSLPFSSQESSSGEVSLAEEQNDEEYGKEMAEKCIDDEAEVVDLDDEEAGDDTDGDYEDDAMDVE
jgi:hypothetical protein